MKNKYKRRFRLDTYELSVRLKTEHGPLMERLVQILEGEGYCTDSLIFARVIDGVAYAESKALFLDYDTAKEIEPHLEGVERIVFKNLVDSIVREERARDLYGE